MSEDECLMTNIKMQLIYLLTSLAYIIKMYKFPIWDYHIPNVISTHDDGCVCTKYLIEDVEVPLRGVEKVNPGLFQQEV